MTNVLLFLGAGASKAFDVPTMKEFVGEIEEWVRSRAARDSELLRQTKNKLRSLYGDDSDLERLLDVVHDISTGKPSMDLFKDLAPEAAIRIHDLADGLPQAASALKEIDYQISSNKESAVLLEDESIECINKKCMDASISKASTAYSELTSFLTTVGFKDGAGSQLTPETVRPRTTHFQRLNVATTNYDLCFEAFCAQVGASWSTGFASNASDQEASFQGAPQEGLSNFPILKLHGSVDWWRTDRNRVIRRPHGAVGQGLLDGSKITRMEIRYPIGAKDLFGDPYLKLYARFAEWLTSCPIWIFIGYSFADPSVRQLVRESMREATKMYILHPHTEFLEQGRLSGLTGGRVYYVKDRFPSKQLEQVIRNTAAQ